MTPGGFRSCRSPYQNLFSIDLVEDGLARDLGSVGGSHSGSTSCAPSYNPTPGLKLVPALMSTSVSALAPLSSNELFKQFMKAYLESNQGPKQSLAEYKQSLKAKVPKVYYSKLYMDCYYFCQ